MVPLFVQRVSSCTRVRSAAGAASCMLVTSSAASSDVRDAAGRQASHCVTPCAVNLAAT